MSIPALYPGRCAVCQETFEEGELISRDPDDNGWCHADCGDENDVFLEMP